MARGDALQHRRVPFGTQDSQSFVVAALDLGAGGVKIGDPYLPEGEADTTSGIIVSGNYIHNIGIVYPAAVGVWIGQNLTPDKETGLGDWTDDQIVAAITKGVRPDGRKLAPIMPWQELAALAPDDAKAIVAYLRSLPPVNHAVPGPFGPSETPSTLVFVIVPDEVYRKTAEAVSEKKRPLARSCPDRASRGGLFV